MSPKNSVRNGRTIDLIRESVKSEGVRGFARATGLSPGIITRYLKGEVNEPSLSTLQKLADYYKVPVPWLQGHWSEMSLEGAKEYRAVLDSGKRSGWLGDVYGTSMDEIVDNVFNDTISEMVKIVAQRYKEASKEEIIEAITDNKEKIITKIKLMLSSSR